MTTTKDNITKRIQVLGEGKEETIGVPQTGFADATGEYPSQEYFFGTYLDYNTRAKLSENNLLEVLQYRKKRGIFSP